ncbi:hypothetical protein [Mycobacterium barrassiae]|uniref:hypothetical protein n=1 Tax=Mycobacterium barrassiae TaxID=319709 RepID=UPI002265B23F|nr:hypothetical protein [Mycobacterium barrassiae]
MLAFWPAALAHASALPDPPTAVVHVAVGPGRNLRPLPRIVLHRTPDFELRADVDRSPPAIRLEHAVIDVVSGELHKKDVAAAFAVQARVCASRRTTPERILRVLAARERVSGRRTLEAMLADVRDGACSVLERGYLHRVERAHGLPRGSVKLGALRLAGSPIGMCTTGRSEWSSNSTAARSTMRHGTAIVMPCVISRS